MLGREPIETNSSFQFRVSIVNILEKMPVAKSNIKYCSYSKYLFVYKPVRELTDPNYRHTQWARSSVAKQGRNVAAKME
jgi:hypothetical protein